MKTIFIDAINGFVLEDGTIFEEMHIMLETFPNKKIILTGANDEQFKEFGLDKMPWEVFTLKHNPEKSDPQYYKTLLDKLGLKSEDVVYFENNKDAVKSAQSVGIKTYFYDHTKQDVNSLKEFLAQNL